jgi:hypothetical protein
MREGYRQQWLTYDVISCIRPILTGLKAYCLIKCKAFEMEQNVFQILNKTATCMSYQLQDTSKSVSIIISQKRYKKYSIFLYYQTTV